MDQFLVRFWGVRGSYPVPGPTTLRYGGNTPCIEVQVGGHTLILDGGTGLIALGKEMQRRGAATGQPITATLLFSHTHHDHTQGVPYFEPAYLGTSTLYIFGPRFFQDQISEALAKTMLPPNFPLQMEDLPALKVIRDIHETEQLYLWPGQPEPRVRHRFRDPEPDGAADAVRVDVCKSFAHPQEGVLFYRITFQGRSLVYATDTEGYVGGDQRLCAFARDADLLIHDAQYTSDEYRDPAQPRQGWGHSTAEMALQVARQANARRVIFFHLNPSHDDALLDAIAAHMRESCPHSLIAREGMTLDLLANEGS